MLTLILNSYMNKTAITNKEIHNIVHILLYKIIVEGHFIIIIITIYLFIIILNL
jgi:hypothetical protein